MIICCSFDGNMTIIWWLSVNHLIIMGSLSAEYLIFTCSSCIDYHLIIWWSYADNVMIICWSCDDHLIIIWSSSADLVMIMQWSSADIVLIVCRPCDEHLLSISWLSDDPLMIIFRKSWLACADYVLGLLIIIWIISAEISDPLFTNSWSDDYLHE